LNKGSPPSAFLRESSHKIFEDPGGKRSRRVKQTVLLLVLLVVAWLGDFVFRAYDLADPPQVAGDPIEPTARNQSLAADRELLVMAPPGGKACGTVFGRAFRVGTPRFAYLPFDDLTAETGLRARCSEIDAVLYEAYTFGGTLPAVTKRGPFADAFPLAEMRDASPWQHVPDGYPMITPSPGMSVEQLADVLDNPAFKASLAEMQFPASLSGVCLNFMAHPTVSAELVLASLNALRSGLAPDQQKTCLVGPADAGFWQDADVIDATDTAIAVPFSTQGGPTISPYDHERAESAVALFKERVPAEKRVLATGAFGQLWRSGAREAELLPHGVLEDLKATFDGVERWDETLGVARLRYLDDERRLNLAWIMDERSYRLQRGLAGLGQATAIWPIGYEPASVWGNPVDGLGPSGQSQVIVEGVGPFVSLSGDAAAASSGPAVMTLYGSGDSGTVAFAFNGLGSYAQEQELRSLLRAEGISATFFVSAADLLIMRNRLSAIIQDQHTIGTVAIDPEGNGQLAAMAARISNNLAQSIMVSETGRRALLVRAPAVDGPLPTRTPQLALLERLLDEGYVPTFSSLPMQIGETDENLLFDRIVDAALAREINIISFDFSAGHEADVIAVLAKLVQRLKRDGFTISSLPEIGRTSVDAMMPEAVTQARERDILTYMILGGSWVGVKGYILLFALLFMVRAPIYLLLAIFRKRSRKVDPDYVPFVSVIVPAYNEEKVIARTLQTILASHYGNFEVVVVDDGSKDRTADIVRDTMAKDPRVSLICDSNHGKWHAENVAIAHATGDIFVVVDADTLLHPDALTQIVQPFKDPRVGAVAGTVEVGNAKGILTSLQAIEYKITQIVVRRAHELFGGILVVPGAIGAWRRAAVEKAGYVSGDTITEDADLTVAVHRAGYKVMYQEDARSYTEAPATVEDLMKQRFRWSFGMLQVAWKHRRAILEKKVVGLISITDAVFMQIIGSLLHVFVDLILIFSLIDLVTSFWLEGTASLSGISLLAFLAYVVLTLVDAFNLAAVFWFERKWEWRLFLYLPFIRFGFRQLLYFSSLRAIHRALMGHRGQWNKLNRMNTAQMNDPTGAMKLAS
jgi:poly-beta-1,6 N-acetyl-D-glucosamine synthase